MQTYISTAGEIIEPLAYDVDVIDGEGNKLQAAGDEVPIEARFTPEFVATLRPYDPETEPNPPEREPPPEPPVTVEQAVSRRNAMLDYATQQINPLQDLVDIDEATEADEALLLLWKKYRAAVGKVTTQTGWHLDVQWPVLPAV